MSTNNMFSSRNVNFQMSKCQFSGKEILAGHVDFDHLLVCVSNNSTTLVNFVTFQKLKGTGYVLVFCITFSKGNNFCNVLFAFLHTNQ